LTNCIFSDQLKFIRLKKEKIFTYTLSSKLYPLIKLMGNNVSIKSTELAKVMFKAGLEGTKKTILENRHILAEFS